MIKATKEELINRLIEKFPQYANADKEALYQSFVAQYPEYTPISKEKNDYYNWTKENKIEITDDYDMESFYKSGDYKKYEGGHFPDKYKKPNHITFSDESVYSNDDQKGGKWYKDNQGNWHFKPSEYNLKNKSFKELKQYFNTYEKDAILDTPDINPKDIPVTKDGVPYKPEEQDDGGVAKAFTNIIGKNVLKATPNILKGAVTAVESAYNLGITNPIKNITGDDYEQSKTAKIFSKVPPVLSKVSQGLSKGIEAVDKVKLPKKYQYLETGTLADNWKDPLFIPAKMLEQSGIIATQLATALATKGSTGASMLSIGLMEAGSANEELTKLNKSENLGLSKNEINYLSTGVGVLNGTIESVSGMTGLLNDTVKKNLVKQTVKEVVKDKSLRKVVLKVGFDLAKTHGKEYVAENAQEKVNILAEELARNKNLSKAISETLFKEENKQRSFEAGAIGALTVGASDVMIKGSEYIDNRRKKQIETIQKVDEILNKPIDSKPIESETIVEVKQVVEEMKQEVQQMVVEDVPVEQEIIDARVEEIEQLEEKINQVTFKSIEAKGADLDTAIANKDYQASKSLYEGIINDIGMLSEEEEVISGLISNVEKDYYKELEKLRQENEKQTQAEKVQEVKPKQTEKVEEPTMKVGKKSIDKTLVQEKDDSGMPKQQAINEVVSESVKEQKPAPEVKPDEAKKAPKVEGITESIKKAKDDGKSFDEFLSDKNIVYHGTNEEFDNFSLGKKTGSQGRTSKYGIWFTESKDEAIQYAKLAGKRNYQNQEKYEKIIERLVNKAETAGKKGDFDTQEKIYEEIEKIDSEMKSLEPKEIIKEVLLPNNLFEKDSPNLFASDEVDTIIKNAKRAGYDGVKFTNIIDSPFGMDTPTTQYIIFNPSKIKTRSQLKSEWDKYTPKVDEKPAEKVEAKEEKYVKARGGVFVVKSETNNSWILTDGRRVSKKTLTNRETTKSEYIKSKGRKKVNTTKNREIYKPTLINSSDTPYLDFIKNGQTSDEDFKNIYIGIKPLYNKNAPSFDMMIEEAPEYMGDKDTETYKERVFAELRKISRLEDGNTFAEKYGEDYEPNPMPAKHFDEGDKIRYLDENEDVHEGVVIKKVEDENGDTTIIIQNGQTLELDTWDTVLVVGKVKQATKSEVEEKIGNYLKEDVTFTDEDYESFISGEFDYENIPDYSGMFDYEEGNEKQSEKNISKKENKKDNFGTTSKHYYTYNSKFYVSKPEAQKAINKLKKSNPDTKFRVQKSNDAWIIEYEGDISNVRTSYPQQIIRIFDENGKETVFKGDKTIRYYLDGYRDEYPLYVFEGYGNYIRISKNLIHQDIFVPADLEMTNKKQFNKILEKIEDERSKESIERLKRNRTSGLLSTMFDESQDKKEIFTEAIATLKDEKGSVSFKDGKGNLTEYGKALMTVAKYNIRNGAIKLRDFVVKMKADTGKNFNKIRKYLRELYDMANRQIADESGAIGSDEKTNIDQKLIDYIKETYSVDNIRDVSDILKYYRSVDSNIANDISSKINTNEAESLQEYSLINIIKTILEREIRVTNIVYPDLMFRGTNFGEYQDVMSINPLRKDKTSSFWGTMPGVTYGSGTIFVAQKDKKNLERGKSYEESDYRDNMPPESILAVFSKGTRLPIYIKDLETAKRFKLDNPERLLLISSKIFAEKAKENEILFTPKDKDTVDFKFGKKLISRVNKYGEIIITDNYIDESDIKEVISRLKDEKGSISFRDGKGNLTQYGRDLVTLTKHYINKGSVKLSEIATKLSYDIGKNFDKVRKYLRELYDMAKKQIIDEGGFIDFEAVKRDILAKQAKQAEKVEEKPKKEVVPEIKIRKEEITPLMEQQKLERIPAKQKQFEGISPDTIIDDSFNTGIPLTRDEANYVKGEWAKVSFDYDKALERETKAIVGQSPDIQKLTRERKIIEQKFNKYLQIIDQYTSSAGSALQEIKDFVTYDETSISMNINKATVAKGKELTDEERSTLISNLEKAKVAKETLEKENEILKKQLEKALKEDVQNKIVENTRDTSRRRGGIEASKKRQAEAMERLMKMGFRASVLNDITQITAETMKALKDLAIVAYEIAYRMGENASLDKVIKETQSIYPDFTETDILKAMSAKVRKSDKRVISDETRRLNEIRKEATLYLDIETALDTGKRLNKEINKQEDTTRVKELKKTLNQIEKDYENMLNSIANTVEDFAELTNARKRVDKILSKIAEVRESLESNNIPDFRKQYVSKTKTKVDEMIDDLKKEHRGLESELRYKSKMEEIRRALKENDFTHLRPKKQVAITNFKRLRAKVEYNKAMSSVRKAIREQDKSKLRQYTLEFFSSVQVTLQTMGDLPPLFNQLAFLSVGHPIAGTKAFTKGTGMTVSKKSFEDAIAEIQLDTSYDKAVAAKLDMDLTSEFFDSTFVDKIPVLKNIKQGSERGFIGSTTLLRYEIFKHYAENVNPDATIDELKTLADFLNKATGRGNVGTLARKLKYLMYSPSFTASKWQMPRAFINAMKYPKMRKMVMKDFLLFIGSRIAMNGLMALLGGIAVWDIFDKDFLKVKFGDDSIDFFGGILPEARMLLRIIAMGFLDEEEQDEIRSEWGSEVGRYLKNKVNPFLSSSLEFWTRKDYKGQFQPRIDYYELAGLEIPYAPAFSPLRFVPIAWATLLQVFTDETATPLKKASLTPFAFTAGGINISKKDNPVMTEKERQKRIDELLRR